MIGFTCSSSVSIQPCLRCVSFSLTVHLAWVRDNGGVTVVALLPQYRFKSHAFVCTKIDSAEYLVLTFPNIVSDNRNKSCLFESALKQAEIMEKLMTKLPEGVVDNKTGFANANPRTNVVNVAMYLLLLETALLSRE
jgi:hypothetical protein